MKGYPVPLPSGGEGISVTNADRLYIATEAAVAAVPARTGRSEGAVICVVAARLLTGPNKESGALRGCES